MACTRTGGDFDAADFSSEDFDTGVLVCEPIVIAAAGLFLPGKQTGQTAPAGKVSGGVFLAGAQAASVDPVGKSEGEMFVPGKTQGVIQ